MNTPLPGAATETQKPGIEGLAGTDRINARLATFRVISNSFTNLIFSGLPIVIAILLLADWLIGSKAFTANGIRLTGALTITLMVVLASRLFNQVPYALGTIWQRNLIVSANHQRPAAEAFYDFLDEFEFFLNRRLAWLMGLVGVILGLSVTYPIRFWIGKGYNPLGVSGWLAYYLWGGAGIVALPLGFLVGLIVWRIGIIAFFVGKLGSDFVLMVQPDHPDQSGGLKPLGNLCFMIAFLLLAPAIYLSVWGFMTSFFPIPSDSVMLLWSGVYRQWLVGLSVTAILVFFQPLYNIHLQMEKQGRKVQAELDRLSQKIEELSLELRTQSWSLTPVQGNEKIEAIEVLQKIYQRSSRVPTWPFDWNTLVRFLASQAVPVIGLIGTSAPIIDLVKSWVPWVK